MNLPWLTSISRMLSQQAAALKGCHEVTSTKTPKYFYTNTTKKKYLVEVFCLAFSSRKTCTSQKMNSRSTWTPDDSKQPKATSLLLCNSQIRLASRTTTCKHHCLPASVNEPEARNARGLPCPGMPRTERQRYKTWPHCSFTLVFSCVSRSFSDSKVNMLNKKAA